MDLTQRRDRLLEHEAALCAPHDSPVYVFYEDDVRDNYRTLRSALDEHYPDSTIHFAVKANYNPAILSILRDEGCHAEVYARGELAAAQTAGYDADDLLLTGMNRRPEDIERALEQGVGHFLVDNATELERLVAAARKTDVRPRVLIRCNPSMEVPTHPEVATATLETKFGLDIDSGRAMAVTEKAVAAEEIDLAGIQLHIGSQIQSAEPYGVAAREMCAFAADIRDELGVEIDVLDLGGGLPVPYDDDVPAPETIIETIATNVKDSLSEADIPLPTLFLEPGRRLVGNAGTLLARVGVIKETPYATFAVLDAGTNTVSSYWPYPIYALSDEEPTESYHLAGPLCYSGDVLAEDVSLPPLERGDTIAIDRIGAYSLGSASHTNAQPKPPIVLLRSNGDVETIRQPESVEEIIGNAQQLEDLALDDVTTEAD
ncbi:diaminopimelate decarboxylase [Natrialba hulunbeirensis JCM 10989]|uniref:Diaminopimelate decarboxylase n=1 Tax=Natrialba hulunbeirensis JCM 10989 TaxID=1227493 RepID=M0A0L9_9EURY|nr:diaminopimelate decarboxylase [Natrialba hulunbeirensis]ELY92300.1 diaminopimelate decarboxylase [Natrialba hulunbeirensis JCM 10989]